MPTQFAASEKRMPIIIINARVGCTTNKDAPIWVVRALSLGMLLKLLKLLNDCIKRICIKESLRKKEEEKLFN